MGNEFSRCCKKPELAIPKNLPIREPKLLEEKVISEKPSHSMAKQKRMSINNFELLGELGQGGFGKVFLVRKKNSEEQQALKMIKKTLLAENKNKKITIDEIFNEKNIMINSDNPFLVKLICCFQDEGNLYFLMELVHGGNLYNYLATSKKHYFSEDQTKFYCAEVVLALEHLHEKMKIIYRDLKPENILLTRDGHIKLADFGLAKRAESMQGEVKGTPDFIAPEIYNNQEYTKMVDYWSLGCLVFELLFGKPAFTNDQKEKRLQKITSGRFIFPSEISVSDEAKSLIKKLLEVKVSSRLGFNGIDEIKNHPFFASVNWESMKKKEITPPIQKLELKYTKISSYQNADEPKGINVDGFTYIPEFMQHAKN